MIDSKMGFFDQIKQAADKAADGVKALSRLMANVGGPRSSKRRLIMTAVQSALLYGAEVWADALKKKSHRNKLVQVQRQSALRVCSAYRTVSEPAVLVIAGVIPVDLLAKERRAVFLRKGEIGREAAAHEERARTMELWQQSWERESRGRWTEKLIKNLSPWMSRKHGEVGYYLTQLLSGHGYFRSYLRKIGKHVSSDCLYCPGTLDDAEHTFFSCERWLQERSRLADDIGAFSLDTIVEAMLKDEESWEQVARYAESILRTKKTDLDDEL